MVNLGLFLGSGALAYYITAGLSLLMAVSVMGLSSPIKPGAQAAKGSLQGQGAEAGHGAPESVAAFGSAEDQQDGAHQIRKGRPWSVLLPALLVVFANVSIELGYAG